jgi:hypothetical protein
VQRIAEKLLSTDMQPGDAPPLVFMDLQQSISIMKNYIVDASSRNVPADRIQKLIDWTSMAQEMIKKASAPLTMPETPQAAPGPEGLPPQDMAQTMMPPTVAA